MTLAFTQSIMNRKNFRYSSNPPEIRIGHVVSCFLLGHEYKILGTRHEHREYVCIYCGHPLLFRAGRDRSFHERKLVKCVKYFCNLFGHRAHEVCDRNGFTEYACNCGHSFLKKEKGLLSIQHPLVCTFRGHLISRVEERSGLIEYVCRNCGHTFCFTEKAKNNLPHFKNAFMVWRFPNLAAATKFKTQTIQLAGDF
jgi:DNA-directed RNA polymerase subunit RPC12/RpoP